MIKLDIPKEIKDFSRKKKIPIWKMFLALCVFVLLLSIFLVETNKMQTQKLNNPLFPKERSQNKQYNYHSPVQFAGNFPKELLIEEVANEQIGMVNRGFLQTTYTYDSKNSAKNVLELYKNALNSNGWIISSETGSNMEASKGTMSVSITVNDSSKGSMVSAVLEQK